jgi:hypothetical protein
MRLTHQAWATGALHAHAESASGQAKSFVLAQHCAFYDLLHV